MQKGGPRKRRLVSRIGLSGPRGQKALVVLKWGAIAGLALGAIFAATIALLFWIWGSDDKLPNIEKLSDYRPSQVSRVLSADGAVVGEIYTQRRTVVPFER